MAVIANVSWCSPAVPLAGIYFPGRPRRRISPTAAEFRESRGNRMFVFGVGFVGRYVSERLIKEGWQLSGTCMTVTKKKELEQIGIDAFVFDANKTGLRSLKTLQDSTHLLISIPPIAGIGDPLLCLHEDLQATLSHGNLQWLCYLSSTSIYGDCGGAWVDEYYPANPTKDSSKSRLAAEKGWLDLGRELGATVNVFRLGGIYGPGRSALDRVLKQKPMSKEQKIRESKLYTARVHVADIYQAINASFSMTSSGIYNVVDDDPAPRGEVFDFARDLIEKRWPEKKPLIRSSHAENSDKQRSKLGEEKRVSNARLKNELGVKLLNPTYRSGLQSILDSWKNKP